MDNQKLIATELEQEIKKMEKNPFAKGFLGPLRLLVVWIKTTSERLEQMESQLKQ
ncbi:hypothetical protein QNF03_002262 [Vibrio cidicii]|uniref:hypothetical protein n=1 Tax=Vibrio cidicii TaxID=1763883 RepID=UPI000A836495|nr:hypothetical protein [Vibrio cidicii]ELV8625607.1 hypothetical protein [Vibrio cidicii]